MLRRLIYNLMHWNSKPGGLVLESVGDGASPKFARYREIFAEELFGYQPVKTLGRARAIMKHPSYPRNLAFQDSILSCVPSSLCELKQFYLDWELYFTWRWPYGNVRHFNGGTRFKDIMRVCQRGMLLDVRLPTSQFWGGEARMQTVHLYRDGRWHKATKEELDDLAKAADDFGLGSWSYVYYKDRTAMKHALQKAPIPVGLWIQKGNWHSWKDTNRKIYWDTTRSGNWAHLVLMVDWDDDLGGWWITDHDGSGLKLLDYNYPLVFAASVSDGKSGEDNPMLRVIKLADKSEYYVVFTDNTKAHIPEWELFIWGAKKGIWVPNDKVEVVREDEFNTIQTDDESKHLFEIMNAYHNSHKK